MKVLEKCVIDCGPGWKPLIEKLAKIAQSNADKCYYPQLRLLYAKEKFGGLRLSYRFEKNPEYDAFYARIEDKRLAERPSAYIRGMVDFAEYMSNFICEKCGKPGVKNDSGWIKCRCGDCE